MGFLGKHLQNCKLLPAKPINHY